MRGEDCRDAERAVEVAQGVGVDHDRDSVRHGVVQRLARRVAPAGPDGPRLDPALADYLGVVAADDVGHRVGADVAHHPCQPGACAGDAEQRRAGIGGRAGADADDAAGVLVGLRVGPRQQASHVGRLQRLDRRLR